MRVSTETTSQETPNKRMQSDLAKGQAANARRYVNF